MNTVDLRQSKVGRLNLHQADLRQIDMSEANLRKVDLSEADLRQANLSEADLSEANLYRANLEFSNLRFANLSGADLTEATLGGTNFYGANLNGVDLHLTACSLHETNQCGLDFSEANLNRANLSGVNLKGANLCRANLRGVHALRTSFEGAVFTGACLEDWNINSATKFEGAICEYVYLKRGQQERRPREGIFHPGEFAALFQQAVDTVDLIFKDGIDWQAFFQSFQDLRSQYADQDLSIQAIEKKRGGAFVVRIEVPSEGDKTVIENRLKELYASEVKALEAQYEERLRLQGQHLEDARQTIDVERRDKASLMAVMSTMASTQQGPKYDMRGAHIAGGVADAVGGNQVGGTINNATSETPSLAETAAEIQNLLKQLEVSNPTATEADQTAYLNAMIPPTRREQFVETLRAAGGAAIEEVPYGAVLKALVEGWQKAGG